MKRKLPRLKTDGYIPGAATPSEQMDFLLYQFISGKPITSMPPKCMLPESEGIWELRTHDLRFFGWFWRKGVFVISSAETKARCKTVGVYGRCRLQARRDRDRLELDLPKFVNGRLEDVL
jgi:hypothetical protein